MPKLLFFSCAVTALVIGTAAATDSSLESTFGKNRVKIQRLETPKDVAAMKLQTVRARYDARMRECREKSDRSKQYCIQETEQQLMIDERQMRKAARNAE